MAIPLAYRLSGRYHPASFTEPNWKEFRVVAVRFAAAHLTNQEIQNAYASPLWYRRARNVGVAFYFRSDAKRSGSSQTLAGSAVLAAQPKREPCGDRDKGKHSHGRCTHPGHVIVLCRNDALSCRGYANLIRIPGAVRTAESRWWSNAKF